MATYGKRRHILPPISGPRGPSENAESKRHKAGIHCCRPYRKSTAHGADGSSPPALSRRDSIDELAAILLNDSIMEDSRVDQAEKVKSSLGFAVSTNNPSKVPSVPSRFPRCTLVLHGGPPQSYSTATSHFNTFEPDDGRSEEILPTCAIRSSDFPLEYGGIMQPTAFSPNNMVNFDNMEAMATVSKDFKPGDSHSLRSGQHPRLDDPYSRTSNIPSNEARPDTWRATRSKSSNLIDNGCSPLAQHGVPQVEASTYNPEELNRKIKAMMAATHALKPDGAASVRPGPYSPSKNSRAKDSNVLSKMKTAMSHPFQTLANKKSPNSAEPHNYIRVISQPQLISRDAVPQSAVMERRINEGDNLKNPKIFNMTSHGQIRRKPLPDDTMYLRSQNPTSYQITQSASEPILSSDTPGKKSKISEGDSAIEPFPHYDSNYDVPFSSSPIAQSTPRIHVHPVLEEGDMTMKSLSFASPTPTKMCINKSYSDADMPLGESDMACAQGVQIESAKVRPKLSARSSFVGRTKKHPSPSKAQLERWEEFMNRYPSPDLVASLSEADGTCDSKVSLHPLSNILALKSTNSKLRETTKSQENNNNKNFNNAELLQCQVPDASKKSTADDTANRSKGRKSFVSKNRCSKTRSRESTLSSRSRSLALSRGIEAMEIDELQWDEPGLLKKAT